MKTARAMMATLRPHQWVKNLFVAAPLVFGKKLTEPDALAMTAAAVAVFCALSGAVYAMNDVLDVERDRAHLTKCRRPVASGQLSARAALGLAFVLAATAIAVAAALSLPLAVIAGSYLTINILYSVKLKEVVFVDIMTIATGFLLRVLGGAYAAAVSPSLWLLACTALLAAFLALGKRAHELAHAAASTAHPVGKTRAVLVRYQLAQVRLGLYVLAVAASVAYVLYTRSSHTIWFFGTDRMLWTAPFCVVGIGRFLVLVTRTPRGNGPTDEMLRDWPFIANLAAWGAAVLGIIYWR